MKTYLRICIAVIFAYCFSFSTTFGKGYTIPIHSYSINKVDTSQTIISIQLKNNDTLPGSRIDTIQWAFINNGFDNTGWSYNFCDFANCYIPPLPSGEIDFLTPRTDGAFTLTITSFNNKAASATMLIKVWDPKDIANPDTISISVNAERLGFTSIKNPQISFEIYPIPAIDNINLFVNKMDNSEAKVTIYNVFGEMIYQQNVSYQNNKIPINGWNSGTYFLSIVDKYGRESRKPFVVN